MKKINLTNIFQDYAQDIMDIEADPDVNYAQYLLEEKQVTAEAVAEVKQMLNTILDAAKDKEAPLGFIEKAIKEL